MTLKTAYFNIGDLTEVVKEIDPIHNGLFRITDEITYGRLFAEVFKGVARYNTTAKTWMYYNGIIWAKDEGNVMIERFAQYLDRALMAYMAEAVPLNRDPTETEKKYQHYIMRLGDRAKRLKMIEDAKSYVFITANDLDSYTDLLNCQNCVVNLKTFEILEHKPDYFFSKVTNVYVKQGARSEDWESFIDQVTTGDKAKAEYLQRLFGYAMTADNTQEECYMIYGPTTRNGKSTTLETVSYMLGDYCMNMSTDSLAQQKRDSRTASGDIARLAGCRMVHCSEPSKKMIFSVELLKNLLGRDKITARNLYEREFDFTPQFKLFINTNYLPTVNDDTLFSSGRIKVITFDKHFSDSEQDRGLKDRLISKDNISGLFNWCLEGLRKYYKEGTTPPACVIEATAQYRKESDKVGRFVAECLEQSSGHAVMGKDAYHVYSGWCRSNGYGIENKSNFFKELKSKGLLSETGTVNGITRQNVLRDFLISTDAMEMYGNY